MSKGTAVFVCYTRWEDAGLEAHLGGRDYPETPDGRYFVSRGRLWRKTDPALPDSERRAAIKALMQARMAIRNAEDEATRQSALADVEAAKVRLGEKGPVWWRDGARDEQGTPPRESSYRAWWERLDESERRKGL